MPSFTIRNSKNNSRQNHEELEKTAILQKKENIRFFINAIDFISDIIYNYKKTKCVIIPDAGGGRSPVRLDYRTQKEILCSIIPIIIL